jgi:SAM-dependent methyltransferase
MKLINIGCGSKVATCGEWVNVDMNPELSKGVKYVNLLNEFPFSEGEFQVVYHSQVLEHFPKENALAFMNECYKILQPGGIIRVVVPDLEFLCTRYLSLLSQCLAGASGMVQTEYELILLKIYDQAVRNKTGGMMSDFLQGLSENDQLYLSGYFGRVGRKIIEGRDKNQSIFSMLKKAIRRPEQIFSKVSNMLSMQSDHAKLGRFRLSGEIHYWMYDFYSLKRLMLQAGFVDIIKLNPHESLIENWTDYDLDVIDGQICDPGSLFVEATKL